MNDVTFRNRFLNSLRVDLRRAVVSKRFLICVLCEILILLLIVVGHMQEEGASVAYMFAWFPLESLYMAFFVLPAIPYAHGYMLDLRSRFLIQAEMRTGRRTYAASKACAAVLSGALSMMASKLFLLLILMCFFPISSKYIIYLNGYELWAINGQPALYFLSQFLLAALMGGLVAAFALWVSTWMQNPFVIVAAPLIGYYAQDTIYYFLKLYAFPYLNLGSILFFSPGFSSLSSCLLYSCFVLFMLIGLFMYLFVSKIIREV